MSIGTSSYSWTAELWFISSHNLVLRHAQVQGPEWLPQPILNQKLIKGLMVYEEEFVSASHISH